MSQKLLGRYHHAGLLILRIGIGFFYVYVHGMPKLFGGPEAWTRYGQSMQHVGVEMLPTVWGFLAAFAEFFGGVALILGLLFSPALVLLFITMVVAAIMHLSTGDGLGGAAHSIKMAVIFFSLFLIGPGRYSLDRAWRSKRRRLYR